VATVISVWARFIFFRPSQDVPAAHAFPQPANAAIVATKASFIKISLQFIDLYPSRIIIARQSDPEKLDVLTSLIFV
jgi:hypothetical protein